MPDLKVHIVPVLNDNYAYILEGQDRKVAIIDPGEAGPVKQAIEEQGFQPQYILLTHHHGDHIGGVDDLQVAYKCKIFGPKKDAPRLPDLDTQLEGEETFEILGKKIEVIETPGHTQNHICFYIPQDEGENILFAGDTLFSMGCGRVFEGTMEEMHKSLQDLKSLPEDTKIYCGHEYTLSNLRFALSEFPDDQELAQKLEEVQEIRDKGRPSIPSTLREEKALNPFLKARSAEEFADIRRKKDAA